MNNISVSFVSGNLTRSSGGVFEIEVNLSQALLKEKVKVNVIGMKDQHWEMDKHKWYPITPSSHNPVFTNSYKFAPNFYSDLKMLNSAIGHSHLLWLYPNLAMYIWAQKNKKPYMITLNGMLDKWTFHNSYWKKQLVWNLYEKRILANANCIHVNSTIELESLRSFGLKTPVCIIPNGISIHSNQAVDKIPPRWKDETRFKDKKILLFLGRLHPKKGLDNLIVSWKKIVHENKDWVLVVAGWGNLDYRKKLEKAVDDNNLSRSIHFIGPQFNIEKKRTFLVADAFILPSFSEGFPMAVLEAWSFSLPVLMTPNCNIPLGFSQNAALNIAPSVEGILNGLHLLFSLTKTELNKIGQNGYNLVKQNYNWTTIAQNMKEVYEWLLGGNMPSNVEISNR